jgi:hypothetical protein
MATYNASLKDGPYSTVALADAAFDAWITLVDARFQVVAGGDLATRAYGSLTANVKCENAGGDSYTFRYTLSVDTGTVAAGAPDANLQTIITSYSGLWTAVEGQSEYTTVTEVNISGSLTFSD